MSEVDGVINPSADKIPRKNMTWSDTNLDFDYSKAKEKHVFSRLQCHECGNLTFEVLGTGDNETSARCVICGTYYIVNSG